MRGREGSSGDSLEVEDVERILDLRDDRRLVARDLLRAGRRLRRTCEQLAERRGPQARDGQRARRRQLQQPAPCDPSVGVVHHFLRVTS